MTATVLTDPSAPRPAVKWAGGKRRLLSEIIARIPERFQSYYEPFVGGGALLLNLEYSRATAGDVNEELINLYQIIQSRVEELIEALQEHHHDQDYYYEIRAQDPAEMDPVARAARMLYLNRTCYNGLYRVNSRGRFNVPFGRYKNPIICDEANLRRLHTRFADIRFIQAPYFESAADARKEDFVYFDPPYEPITSTSFVNYARDGFSAEDQARLAEFFRKLSERGVYCMLSNSRAKLIRELYRGFTFHAVTAMRSVNSVASGRGKIGEYLITNY